jgi:hypothetical protein
VKALAKEMPAVAAPLLSDSDIERFWSKVDIRGPDECWLWTGAVFGPGYGGFELSGRTRYAHRVSLMIKTGTWPGKSLALHSCDVRRCVNPSHLRPGTPMENRQDAVDRGRLNPARGERHSSARLTADIVLDLRRRYCGAMPFAEMTASASEYGVTYATVYQAVTRRTWRHLP